MNMEVSDGMQQFSTLAEIKDFLTTLPNKPGVYRFLSNENEVIYVGKARALKKRVSSYFSNQGKTIKTSSLVSRIHSIEVTITNNETEALILENNLIKKFKPRYNVSLRDDKSYPFIYLSDDEFPRLGFHRGKHSKNGQYFGPYPSASSVRESLYLIQKLFPIRQCENGFYRNRSRACLQYQIKRCTAPCVGYIDKQTYAQDVRLVKLFLNGKSKQIIDELAAKMETVSSQLDFEEAARIRDRIISLRKIQDKQYISSGHGNVDVIASKSENNVACVQLFCIRGGRNLGNKTFFPKFMGDLDSQEILSAFLPQYYLSDDRIKINKKDIPNEILINIPIDENELLSRIFSEQCNHSVSISCPQRGTRSRWMKLAEENAGHNLSSYLANKSNIVKRFQALQVELKIDEGIHRIECFDISHTQGEATVGSCVVFDVNGAVKSDYRRFNIQDIEPGDDYAAMHQVLSRRFLRVKQENGNLPEVLLIDGGKGQVTQAVQVLQELQITGLTIVGVAKGRDRKPGLETLIIPGRSAPLYLPNHSPALHLIQQIRDEAHRFAITGHRQRRAKKRSKSTLEAIKGLGPKRRQCLLKQFGGLQEISKAGIEDLALVPGISHELAQKIYNTFHPE